MIKLAIFDLDGTLVNSLADLADAVNQGLRQLGHPTHPTEAFRYFVGNGVPKLCERALPADCKGEQEQLRTLFAAYYQAHCMEKTRPYPEMREALDALRQSGLQLAVASNKDHAFTSEIVSHFFGDKLFACVSGRKPGCAGKPDPAILQVCMDVCGCTPAETVMIGDSNVDMLTAQNASMRAIGCLWGFRTAEELQSGGAACLAESPAGLPDCIARLDAAASEVNQA